MTTKQGKNPYATNLLKLQNHIKRDPTSYRDEVSQSFHLLYYQQLLISNFLFTVPANLSQLRINSTSLFNEAIKSQ